MAFSGGGKGIRSDINVTPLIDVVLVLLIVFMVLVPKLLNQMTIDVPPKDTKANSSPEPSDQLVMTISDDGKIALNDRSVTVEELPDLMRTQLQNRAKKLVFFNPTDGANYGLVAKVMDICRGAGAKTLGIITK